MSHLWQLNVLNRRLTVASNVVCPLSLEETTAYLSITTCSLSATFVTHRQWPVNEVKIPVQEFAGQRGEGACFQRGLRYTEAG